MKTCPACQQAYPDEIESCPRDGSRLVAEVRDERECPYCAELILKKARVCKHCGRDVEPVAATGIAAQATPPAPPERTVEPPSAQALGGKPAAGGLFSGAAASRPPEPAKADAAAQTPSPIPPQRIAEPPTAHPQWSEPVGGVLFSGAAAGRPPAASKTPWLRAAPEPPGKMKFVVIAGVALILIVAGVWYFSQPAEKNSNPEGSIKKGDASSPAKAGPSQGEVRVNSIDGLKYVWIPPGSFQMGCSPGGNECESDEKPPHQVTITKGFWLGQTEVTVGAYNRFSGSTGNVMPPAPDSNPAWSNGQMPIVNVSWEDAQAYCTWAGGRLPTEAEWEYAARAGSTEARYGPIDEVAWYSNNSGGKTHEVGQKRANGFGLYDMLGNVWEWVNDWYDEKYYQSSPSQDLTGATSGTMRVLRGGSWDVFPRVVRVSYRLGDFPSLRLINYGFRCGGEAERKRQAEEKAREIKEALGDEIGAQVGYVGLVDAAAASALANNPSLARTWGLDQANGYQIRDLRMYINRKNGSLTITFGCLFNNGSNAPSRMLVRLFDANGEYLTHFVTAEYFAAPQSMGVLGKESGQRPGFIKLRQDSNVLQYSVNLRDAAFARKAEFGLYTGR